MDEDLKRNIRESLVYSVYSSLASKTERRLVVSEFFHSLNRKMVLFNCEVVGFTQGKNARKGFFGSLVLARNGKYRGKAGSGFNDWELRQIKDILSDAPRIGKPFDIGDLYTAVKTDLKVQVKYYKTTKNSVMRFPVFLEVIQ